jgi:cytoskeletal protein CcmA (bactofilin family)
MLRSETLFGKREPAPANPPLSNATHSTANASVKSPLASGVNANQSAGKEPMNNAASTNEVGSKLIVGPNIKLKGVEITDCDTLVVEGRVEATMDSRVIQIAENGAFKGNAEIDIAEIRGEFDGELTVRQKLVIYATGKVSGKIRYGKLVIEEGGQIAGDVQVNSGASSASTSTSATQRALNAA